MIERDKYDLANLGHYHRSYPNADPVRIPTFYFVTRLSKSATSKCSATPCCFSTNKMAHGQ